MRRIVHRAVLTKNEVYSFYNQINRILLQYFRPTESLKLEPIDFYRQNIDTYLYITANGQD